MIERQLELKLIPVSKKLSAKGGYRGHIENRGVMGYDQIIRSVVEKKFLRLDPDVVKMIVGAVLDTMIEGIMKDGYARRLGDYFSLQLEVKGGFDEPGEQFNPEKHKLAMVLRPLKKFRRIAGKGDVSVINRNAGPKVVIEKMYSASHPEGGEIKFGEDIVLEGENLFALEDGNDEFAMKYFSQFEHGVVGKRGSIMPEWASADGRKLVMPWGIVDEFIKNNSKRFDPAKNQPVAIMFGIRSRGGLATAKCQLHRGRAYFDTWLEKHPKDRGDFSHMNWGSI